MLLAQEVLGKIMPAMNPPGFEGFPNPRHQCLLLFYWGPLVLWNGSILQVPQNKMLSQNAVVKLWTFYLMDSIILPSK